MSACRLGGGDRLRPRPWKNALVGVLPVRGTCRSRFRRWTCDADVAGLIGDQALMASISGPTPKILIIRLML